MRRIRNRHRIADHIRRKPSIQHQREPNAPLPLPGCHCDACEGERDRQHWAGVGELLGLDESTEPEGK